MNYISFSLILLLLGVFGVASNPSPYYAALGLVLAALGGCGIMGGWGGVFISLVLFLIYLGGMLVVFSYSAALIADPYPEAWGIWPVLGRVLFFGLLVMIWGFMFGDWEWGYNMGWGLMPMPASGNIYCGVADELHNLSYLRGDFCGVAFLYGLGGMMLIICGWGLLITLFSVLELVRGQSRGALRAI